MTWHQEPLTGHCLITFGYAGWVVICCIIIIANLISTVIILKALMSVPYFMRHVCFITFVAWHCDYLALLFAGSVYIILGVVFLLHGVSLYVLFAKNIWV